MNPVDKRRREFFGQAAAIASTMIAPGLMLYEYAQAKAPADPVSGKVRWGMLIDTTKCAPGCRDCVDACNRENGLPGTARATDSQWIRKVDIKDLKTGKAVSLPVLCQHCAEPPCVDVCPTGASFKREDGIVLVDRHTCIGCRYRRLDRRHRAHHQQHAVLRRRRPPRIVRLRLHLRAEQPLRSLLPVSAG